MTVYLDTSAAAKLLVAEGETAALADFLDDGPDDPMSSWLLETELRRLAVREDLAQSAVTEVLSRVDLVEMDHAVFREAGLLADPTLRSLDALHLATALRLDEPVILAYDRRLITAATTLGLPTRSPST